MPNTFYLAPLQNYIEKTLSGGIDDTTTTITLNNTTNLRAPGYIVINRRNSSGTLTPNSREVIPYTAISGNDLTGCTRGGDGSTARTHSDQSIVETVLTVGMWNNLATIVSTGFTADGYLKAIGSPVSIARGELTQFVTPSIASIARGEIANLTSSTASIATLNVGTLVGAVGNDGWIAATGWAYASATTITVPAGAASIYQKGDKIKLTQSTVKYFYIVAVADTTLTVTGGSDYTVANAAITSPFYSHDENPLGFPSWFAYTPTGIAASNITLTGRFQVSGKMCHVRLKALFGGAITFTTMPTLPITASASIIGEAVGISGVGSYLDAGTVNVQYGVSPAVIASDTIVRVVRASDSADMSATVPITWANNDVITLHFYYEI